MSKKGLVSIIIPCYNHENFLDDCIKGVLEQSYKDIEFLICDDCSPDGSYQKIKSYEKELRERFSRVEIFLNEENQGVTKNINRMLSIAEGEFIKIIASDDAMLPNAIEQAVTYLNSNPDVDILVCNGAKIAEDQHHGSYQFGEPIYKEPLKLDSERLIEEIFILNTISAPAAIVKKSVFEELGYYDEDIAIEDLEYWLRALSKKTIKFDYLDIPLVLYRVNENSMSSMSNNPRLEGRRIRFHNAEMEILNKYKAFVPESIYSEAIMNRILAEKGLAVDFKLTKLEQIADEELRQFKGWKYISLKKNVIYILRILYANLRKLIRK